jgi:SAM-dependent methyltransferase
MLDDSIDRPEFLDFRPPAEYVNGLAISSREKAIEIGLEEKDLDTIAGIQGLPPYQVLQSLLDTLRRLDIFPELKGLGLELGAGLALFSVACLERDSERKIEGIVALEAVKTFVEKGIQRVGAELLAQRKNHLLPCYGVFENIPVSNETFDFAIQIESLHHADVLDVALKEISRVIRKGGLVVSLDRSWIDTTDPETLEEMLDHEYSEAWLKSKKFPTQNKFMRRDNGEHEYRDMDWISSFEKNGFNLALKVDLHPKIEWWHLIKRVLSILRLSKVLGIKVEPRPGIIRSWIDQSLGFAPKLRRTLLRSPHPRPLSFFVFKKVN